ncbi:hypothetical protein U0070_012150, partial [Myodes glareolus]
GRCRDGRTDRREDCVPRDPGPTPRWPPTTLEWHPRDPPIPDCRVSDVTHRFPGVRVPTCVFPRRSRGVGSTMNEEEQFVNIDLNDDNICSVCKLGTDKETLSFCHICFELNLE